MTARSAINKVREGIKSGVYKTVRLIKILSDGTTEPLVPFSNVSKPEEAAARLSHIEMKIKQGLPAGTYQIQARAGHTKGSLTDSFEFTISDPLPVILKDGEEPLTVEPMPNGLIDFDEYKELLRENAELKADKKLHLMEIEFWKGKAESSPTSLAEQPQEKTWMDHASKVLEDIGPSVMGLLSQHMELKERQISLQEKAASQKTVKQLPSKKMAKKTFSEVLEIKVNRLTELEQTDPEAFEAELDKLEERDPRMFEAVCERMGLEEYEEEDLEPTEEDEEDYIDDEEGEEA